MEQAHEEIEQGGAVTKKRGADGWSFVALFTGIVLLPIFFLPWLGFSLDATKSTLLFVATIVAFLLWLVARMKTGRFLFPKSRVLGALVVVSVVTLLSALFSEVTMISLWGGEYETGAFFSLLVLTILAFLSSIFFQESRRVALFHRALHIASCVILLFFVLGLIASAGLIPASIAQYIVPNVVGKWNDLAAFFGLTGVLSLIALELKAVEGKRRVAALVSLVLSLLVLALVNFTLLWAILGAFALIVFVYTVSFRENKQGAELTERRIPPFSFAVLLISVVFVLASTPVNDFVRSTLKISIPQEVVRPSWYATTSVAKDSLLKNPVFGVGANRFGVIWNRYKPTGINATEAWNVDFVSGIGTIPTFAITTGLLGVIAWLGFLVFFLIAGFSALLQSGTRLVSHYALASSFLGAAYLWTIAFFYVPNIVLFALAFVMTGVFVAVLAESGTVRNYDFSFLEDPRIGFVSVLALILFIIASLVGGYLVGEKFLSLVSYQKSVVLAAQGNWDGAERSLADAKKLRESDLFYRTLSDVEIKSLSSVLSQTGVSTETVKAQFQLTSRDAIDNALKATQFDGSNYVNWLALGHAYEALIPFGATAEFHDSAKKGFEEAIARNNINPALYLELARLELLNKNSSGAKEYIQKALMLKGDYVDAIFLAAQIQADEGDLKNAIISAEAASLVSPNDIGVFFQLGFLRYKDGDYAGAIAALERAVELNPSYSNAKYFLGLSYSKMGRVNDAIRQFEDIKAMNPDNTEVQTILNDLQTTGSAFSGAAPIPPEKKSTPLIKKKK